MPGLNFLPILAGSLVVGAAAVGGYAVLTTSGPFAQSSEAPAAAQSPVSATPVPAPNEKTLTVNRVAGSPPSAVGKGSTVDGQGADARFVEPTGVAIDGAGTIYVADNGANLIRAISAAGFVSTLAGSGVSGLRDGAAATAQFFAPNGLALEADGSLLVADSGNHRIRRISRDGQVTTVAGSGPSGLGRGGFADGPPTTARFNLPKGVAVTGSGDILVSDTDNARIRRISKDGTVTTVAGTGELGKADGGASVATFSNVSGIALGPDGSLFIADQPNNSIRRIDPLGTVTTVAQGFRFPSAVAVNKSGEIFVSDTGNNRVVLLSPKGVVIAEAGGTQGAADGTGRQAQFFNPAGVAIGPAGTAFVTDSTNAILRSVEVSP